MFDRPHHQRIAKILQSLNTELLQEAECYFAGGTAIALSLNEYRRSDDIDFLCASTEGYRLIRNSITNNTLGSLLASPVKHLRDVRTERDKILVVLEMDGSPIKFEIVKEGRVSIECGQHPILGVPTLSRVDMYAQKLLANADRGMDRSNMSRDLIDLAMMIDQWGDIPNASWEKAYEAYGDHLLKAFHQSIGLISQRPHLKRCLADMDMDSALIDKIPKLLLDASSKIFFKQIERENYQARVQFA